MKKVLLPILLLISCTYGVIAQARIGNVQTDLLVGQIDDDSVRPVIRTLERNAPITWIYINSPGGYVSSMHDLIDAMEDYDGVIKCKVDRRAMSAAAVILLACDEKYVTDNAVIMFHSPRTSEKVMLYKNVDNVFEFYYLLKFHHVLNKYGIKQLLSKKAFDAMHNGSDIYIRGDLFMKKLDNLR